MMGKFKIAMMVPTLNSGGAEKVAADLSIYFEQKGYEVFIFSQSKLKVKDYNHGGKIIYVEMSVGVKQENNKTEFLAHLMQDVCTCRELKKKYQIDITISFMQVSNLLNILSRYNDKVIVTLHSVMSYRVDLSKTIGYSEKIFRYLYQLADKIVLVSQFCQEDWIRHYGDLFSKTIVIQNPVNAVVRSARVEENFQWDFGANAVISVARLDGVKQQWHLIRAFKKVLNKCSDAQLLIAGDGILKDALKSLCEQLEIEDHIHFLGFVNDVDRYLQRCKAVVVTSASESWCNAIAEAMVQGVPVVTNDCPGGIRELMGVGKRPKFKNQNIIVDCGIITPKLDGQKYTADVPLTREESLLADGVLQLLKDDDLRQKMSEKCLENVRKYDLQNIGQKWEERLVKTAGRKRTGGVLREGIMVACTILGLVVNFRMRKRKSFKCDEKDTHGVDNQKFVSYFYILDHWMDLKENGISVEKYFRDHGYQKIAIYGMAKMANHLIRELEASDIEILYGIDRKSDMIYGKFPVVSMGDSLADADVIIVTPTFDFENIEKNLREKVKCPIVSLEDVIFYCK